jgi:Flp pilus assembly secretin CpaC
MQSLHRNTVAVALLALMALAGLTALPALAGDFDNTRPGSSQTLILEHGRSVVLKFNGLRRVAVVDPTVADVRVVSSTELLVMSGTAPPLRDQNHTMIYVWDKDGLHNFAATVVGMRLAEQIAVELRESLSPNLNVEVVSDTMVVVEGEVADDEAKENLEALLDAASTDEVKVVGMVQSRADSDNKAAQAAATLSEILDPRLKVTSWGNEVVVVEGELSSREEAARARDIISAVTEGLRVVDMITVRGEAGNSLAPADEIAQVLGPGFTVTPLRGNVVVIDGTVEDAAGLERIARLLEAFDDVQTINMVQVVPPRPDLEAAQRALTAALPETIAVTRVGDEGLMLEGSVPTDAAAAQLGEVIRMFEGRVPIVDLITVVAPEKRRVQVAVKIVELNRGADEELGIDWGQYSGQPYASAEFRNQPFLFGQIPGINGWPELFRFSSQVHALVARQKARVLSEPNLLVNEDEEAEILIGGEIPVPIAQASVGGAASITVEWKPFGVNLKIKPTISPTSDRVMLEVAPEVSSLDFGSGVTMGGLTIPALRTRRAQTVVTIPDGGVLAIGGLLQADQSKSVSKIPILGDLPIIGQLFRHDSFRNDKSELIILVLPQILGEDGEPLHPIPVPEGMDAREVMQFGVMPD